MSLTTRHMIDQVTYWVRSDATNPTDPFASGSWAAPVTVICEFESGGKIQRDQDGEEFMPSSTYYTASEIPAGAFVVLGSSVDSSPPATAEKVRKIGKGTSLRGQASEFVSWTG